MTLGDGNEGGVVWRSEEREEEGLVESKGRTWK